MRKMFSKQVDTHQETERKMKNNKTFRFWYFCAELVYIEFITILSLRQCARAFGLHNINYRTRSVCSFFCCSFADSVKGAHSNRLFHIYPSSAKEKVTSKLFSKSKKKTIFPFDLLDTSTTSDDFGFGCENCVFFLFFGLFMLTALLAG